MPKARTTELLVLSPAEKLDLIETLWESLDLEQVPMPDWHCDVLEQRERSDDPAAAESWDLVKKRLAARE